MSIVTGQSILHYRLEAPIGQGGMGIVWRAHDTSLGRDVALKFLPAALAGDPERMARLEREARLLAALNHPRIAAIYGFHTEGRERFLAMEYVEGEDLAQRLQRGPIAVEDALPLALQIAEALEHAHEKGVIHRDLKPANVKLDAAGGAKVLDFGLAKAIEGDPATGHSGSALSHSPTITGGMTAANVLLGTAAYMSPEQARGQVADRRADVWAFGVMLWEMLTGRRLFEGETISDTLAAVLRSDPDFAALPQNTPPRVRRLLRRCLERNAKQRLRDIGEARIALDETLRGVADEGASAAATATSPQRGRAWPVVFAALVLGAVLALGAMRLLAPPASEAPLRKFAFEPDTSAAPVTATAISPDGRQIAALAGGRLLVRDLARLESRSFPIESDAQCLFWSPSSREIGYFTGSRVAKASAADGARQVISDTRAVFSGGSGGFWSPRGVILFSRGDGDGVLEVPERGGDPRIVVPRDSTEETDLHEPFELPGGRGIVFYGHSRRLGFNRMYLWAGGKRRLLLEIGATQSFQGVAWSPSGHILFRRMPTNDGVWALPFSLAKLEPLGEPFLVTAGASLPSVSQDGTLCFRPGGATNFGELVVLSRDGTAARSLGAPRERSAYSLGLDPAGTRLARPEWEDGGYDIWIYDLERQTRSRLTFEDGEEEGPEFSPDGRRIVYFARPRGCAGAECFSILGRAADGSGRVDTLVRGDAVAPVFTPDGREILYTAAIDGAARWNIARIAADGSGSPETLVRGNPRALFARVSPDGTLMAYMSSESGRYEVYLTRYPGLDGRWQVSTDGGQNPRWSPRGDRLYFTQRDSIMQVAVGGGGTISLGNPSLLLARPHAGPFSFGFDVMFALSPDERRVYTARNASGTQVLRSVAIVENWASEFREKK